MDRRRLGTGVHESTAPRLRFLEVAEEGWVQAVAQAQELDRVERPLGDPLLHLHPAGAALGRADLDVVVAEAVQQAAAGAERGAEVVARQAVGAGHPRAAAVDELDVELGDLADQVEPRRADVERPEVAGLVVADAAAERMRRARGAGRGREGRRGTGRGPSCSRRRGRRRGRRSA